MKKILFFVLIILLVAGILLLFKQKVGDIRPAILPSVKTLTKQIIPQQNTGEEPTLNLKVNDGFKIGVFAKDLNGVRDLEFTPRGTLLASLPKERSIVALPDKNNDGVADGVIDVVNDLNNPHGIAFYKDNLYVAEEGRVSVFKYDEKRFTAIFERKLFDLPSGGRHHTRSIVFDNTGNMYVSLGSTCDTCVEKEEFIATVLLSDYKGTKPRVYSKGLRNAVFLALNSRDNTIYATEMGRDFLGDNLPPDEINILRDGADYGWPYCYGDRIWDIKFGLKSQEFCNTTEKPFYNIPAHSAPLGLTFINSSQFPAEWQNDLLVSYHGSWNRSIPTGYKVVRISTKGEIKESDFLTGFINGSDADGRPVDVIFDKSGSLFVSDDKANLVYKIVKSM